MLSALKKMALGLLLIVASSAVLLYSDLDSRHVQARGRSRVMRVAIIQHSQISALDDGITGALAALKDRGYVDGGRMILRQYNAQGDIGTANAIAKDVTSGNWDLIFTFSTVTLQTVANANRFASPHRTHIFALVSDPYAAGVGISRENHLQHPPYMTGIGSLAPIDDIFRLARQLRPGLKRVGVVWDPAEVNSVVSIGIARKTCSSLGMELVEANAENVTSVPDAAASLLARHVEAIWVSPDQIASNALHVIIAKANLAHIPVFTSIPRAEVTGTLFDLGADYPEVGRTAGNLAADILDGRDPAAVPVENVMPVTLQVNTLALKNLRDKWEFPPEVVARANVVIDASGRHVHSSPPETATGAPAPSPSPPQPTS